MTVPHNIFNALYRTGTCELGDWYNVIFAGAVRHNAPNELRDTVMFAPVSVEFPTCVAVRCL